MHGNNLTSYLLLSLSILICSVLGCHILRHLLLKASKKRKPLLEVQCPKLNRILIKSYQCWIQQKNYYLPPCYTRAEHFFTCTAEVNHKLSTHQSITCTPQFTQLLQDFKSIFWAEHLNNKIQNALYGVVTEAVELNKCRKQPALWFIQTEVEMTR